MGEGPPPRGLLGKLCPMWGLDLVLCCGRLGSVCCSRRCNLQLAHSRCQTMNTFRGGSKWSLGERNSKLQSKIPFHIRNDFPVRNDRSPIYIF